jgi:hypothetical protein
VFDGFQDPEALLRVLIQLTHQLCTLSGFTLLLRARSISDVALYILFKAGYTRPTLLMLCLAEFAAA